MPILKRNNIVICYEAFGNANNPCVILITGITGQLIDWPSEIIQGLVNKGFYVIAFDNRDVGLSSYYDHLATPTLIEALAVIQQQSAAFQPPYTLNDMAADIIHLMDGLNITKAHIVGGSMGGQIAQIFALEHVERILSLTCMSTSSGDPNLPPPKPEVLDLFFAPRTPVKDLESYIANRIKVHKIYDHPEDFDEQQVRIKAEKSYLRAYHPEGNQRQLMVMMFAAPRGKKLQQLQVSSLIIHGDCDPVVPIEHGEQLAKCLVNSRLVIIKNMGHSLPKKTYTQITDSLVQHFSTFKKYS